MRMLMEVWRIILCDRIESKVVDQWLREEVFMYSAILAREKEGARRSMELRRSIPYRT